MSAILQALDALNDRLVLADAIGEALDHAAGEHASSWVYVYREQVSAITTAAETLETLLRGGMGAVATMDTQKPWTRSPGRVPSPSPAVEDAARTDKPETFTCE